MAKTQQMFPKYLVNKRVSKIINPIVATDKVYTTQIHINTRLGKIELLSLLANLKNGIFKCNKQ